MTTAKNLNIKSAVFNHGYPVARLSALASALWLAGCAVTPSPLGLGSALQVGQADRQILTQATQAPKQRITLEDAMARALLNNRERRVQMMESAMASHQLAVSRFDMLPQLAASAGYTERSTVGASSSAVYENGQVSRSPTPTYSVSADKQGHTSNLALTWNVLDFGLSYLRANQAADRLLIAKERERKAVHNLIQDVRSAYWRAVSSQKLLDRTAALRSRALAALADARRVEAGLLKNPIDALTYQRDLIDVRRSLESLHKDLLDARSTLATLMGLPPSTAFELVSMQDTDYRVPDIKADMQTLERSALALRPELMELRYQKRISEIEGRAALFGLLPSLSLNTGMYRDSNDYLLFNNWSSHGATLGLNLFNVLKTPAVGELDAAQEQLVQERRLALTAAVLGQVHLSRVALASAQEQFQTADDYLKVIRKIRTQMEQMRNAQRSGELELIREEMAELLADLRKDVAYAELQNSYGRVFVSAGLDPMPTPPNPLNLDTLSQAMSSRLKAWDQGNIGVVLNPLTDQAKPWRGPGDKQLQLASDTFSLAGDVRYEAKQSNGQILPSWLKFDAKTQTFSGNPPVGPNSYEIEVAVVDRVGAKVSDRFVLQLEEVNDAPTAGASKLIAVREGSKPIQGKLEAVDADGDPLTFALDTRQKPVPGFHFTSDGRWTFDTSGPAWKPLRQGQKRTVTLRFKASDPHGGTGSLELTFEIVGVNNPPQATPPEEVTLSHQADPVQGQITASDVDEDDALNFAVLGEVKPAGFSLEPNGQWRFNPRDEAYQTLKADERRSLFVPIAVTDKIGAMTVVRLQINVLGAQP